MNNSEISERIRLFMKAKNLNGNQMTLKANLSNGLIGKVLNGGSNLSVPNIVKILHAYPELSSEWLLIGKGEMLKTASQDGQTPFLTTSDGYRQSDLSISTPSYLNRSKDIITKSCNHEKGAIPLVATHAVGGFFNENFSVMEKDIISYYQIPKFRFMGVDFMIEITGESMKPRFFSGDLIACRIIHDSNFIQWGKCYLIASRDQGLIVKHLIPGDNEECVKAVSENHMEFPAFQIPKDDIMGLALIVGSIHVE